MLSVRLLTCLPQPSFAPSWRLAAPLAVLWWCLALPGAHAQAPSPSPLPPEVEAALSRARLPREALSVLVVDAQGGARQAPRLAHRAQVPMNPASVMKLVTTYAALDQLGPAYAWNTPVYVQGTVQDGSLRGNVYIQGQGDPKLVMERLWLLLRRLQGQGIQVIVGDIVLDRTAFDVPEQDPGSFDNEPLRPYNASPDALLVNYKSQVMTFVPDVAAGLARIQYDPPMAGVQRQASVALAAPGADCGDWRGALRAELSDPARIAFQGVFPASCGERVWPIAPADPRGFAARAVEGMWRELGGKLTGSVRDGKVPAGLKPVFVATSPALAEVVRDVNKYSNNVMAQQVFLTLALGNKGVPATFDGARDALRRWWHLRFGDADQPVADNGAGLSRDARITAQGLARMLQSAWASPVMPELVSSLPIAGVDGTLRRSQARGAAHLKTGSLRDVMAIAGYVHGASGRRYVLVAMVNHANAGAARPVLDALTDWAARDQ
ncbi:D-alanyl-D-alanine carboxypeptidase/D-alanyl-D-alanine-endopeptidase [Acidovorax sp. A1169]|uniref:D-alanyl-D-alanine carboxypeptidase/D-alanyl-D-alanine endopeptidase n=1 Tax=Acidovorax sp. A1169 TaxID=3059524 RepID=UPI002737D02D|nr:D-alanyl-D-alanine carboxypeptidase/D-alanyl-D-alanine-endopeptidase [Acidovorax sp. A1169]MDP4075869.1 D-alanyl-D-alanine carboxypeptidase/D-alanyl-D-alanine-endopeptidase [Acidovorax sp. A1169]